MLTKIPSELLHEVEFETLPNVMIQSLYVLESLRANDKDRFGSSEIARYGVETLHIGLKQQSVDYSLRKAIKLGFCHKNRNGFKLLKSGQQELLKVMGNVKMIHIEPGKPFKASLMLNNILENSKGDLYITDSHIDIRTLELLYALLEKKDISIRLLTTNIHRENQFRLFLQDMTSEGIDIEVAILSGKVLHDRYIIDDKNLYYSGTSLNGLGKKESFFMILGMDMRTAILSLFKSRWKGAIKF